MAQNEIRHVFVIGGSSGSFDVLLYLLPHLRPLHNTAIIIIIHRKNVYDTTLAEVFANRTTIPVKEVEEKEFAQSGTIYLAPADYHLLVENDCSFSLDVSEKVNYSRPSIDVSFESAAEVFGNKLTGILLSGSNIDGTSGLKTIQSHGGKTVVQDPATAESPYMPQQAIDNGAADAVLGMADIGDYINQVIAGNYIT